MKINSEWEHKLDALPQGIFFTWFVLAFVVLALFLALVYKQFDLTLFSLTLIVLAIGLKLWSRISPNDLKYRLKIDKQKVFPGEEIVFSVTTENNKFLPVLVEIRLLLPASLASGNEDLLIREHCGILWHQKISFHRKLFPTRRGIYKSGTPRLITGDFFGFFPRPTEEKHEVDILVFPRPTPVKPFPILNRILFGKRADSSPIQDPIHILGTRDYQCFSPAGNIHWKATARHQKLQEKIFEVTEQEKLFIILEADGFIHKANEMAFERTIEVIAALSIEMDAKHFAIGFLTNCAMHNQGWQFLAPSRKTGHMSALFEMLAKINFNLTLEMDDFLESAVYPFAGSSCMVFSYESIETTSFADHIKIPTMNVICRPRLTHPETEKVIMTAGPSCFLEDICEAS
jgi:uncharacterized protein (DUF58 family)